jgi:signal transduction histidine kinase
MLLFVLDLPVDIFILTNTLIFIAVYISIRSANKITDYQERLEQKNLDNFKLTSQQLNMSIHESNMAHNARLEERNLIAQKLHDELGHTLSGNTMQLEAALLLLSKDQDKADAMIRSVINHLRDGSESIRKILKDIQPEHTSLGVQTIKTMISKVKEKSDVSIDFIYNNEITQLSYNEWQCITVNIQEAMTNMMKYSQATQCIIRFERLNKMFKVIIKDNGIGCKNISKGMGFRGMNQRIASLNGQLILDGSDGFTIIMLLPIEKGN